jgi:hypothetical protein
MSDTKELLQRARKQFAPPDGIMESLTRRRDRKQRNRRVGTAVLALVVAAVAIGGVVRAFDLAETSRPAELPKRPESWTRVEFSHISGPGASGNRDSEGTRIWSITAGGPGLVAVGTEDWRPAIWTSADGLTWDTVEQRFGSGWMADVTTGGPGLVAVRMTNVRPAQPGDDAPVWTSADGSAWSRAPSDPVFQGARLQAVSAGGPGLVAVGSDEEGPQAWFSSDGVSWERASVPPPPLDVARADDPMTSPPVEAWMGDVAVAGDRMVAVGTIGLQVGSNGIRYRPTIWTSTDGMTWTEVPLGSEPAVDPGEMLSVADGPEGFVAVQRSDTAPRTTPAVLWTSPDGLVWQPVPSDQEGFVSRSRATGDPADYLHFALESVAAGPGGYVAFGGDAHCIYNVWTCSAAEAAVWTSEDGRIWNRVPSAPVFRLGSTGRRGAQTSVAAAWGDRFVTAGNSGEGTDIWISEAPSERT